MDSQKNDATSDENPQQVHEISLGIHDVSTEQTLPNPVAAANKSTRKRKSNESMFVDQHERIYTSNEVMLKSSPSKECKRSSRRSTRPEVNYSIPSNSNGDPVSTGPSLYTFLDPNQLGMDGYPGDGSTSIRRESSLLHLAMIPQGSSMADFGGNNTIDDEDEEALAGINFMDFYEP